VPCFYISEFSVKIEILEQKNLLDQLDQAAIEPAFF
jgi:hypothetical protein